MIDDPFYDRDEPADHSFTESDDWDDLLIMAAMEQSRSVSAENSTLLSASLVRKKQISYQPKPKERSVVLPKPEASKPSRLKSLGILTGIALMLLAGLLFFSNNTPTLPPPDIAENSSPSQPVTKSIQNVQVGDWVKAENPELTDDERLPGIDSSDPSNLRVITLQMQKASGDLLDMQFLRSVEWLEEHDAYIGEQIDLELSELGTTGIADVRLIEPCPVIMPRPGPDAQLVTGRFIHEAANALDLEIKDQTGKVIETIGVTANHPFWSENRQEFVEAGQLLPGEQLLSAYEESIFVGSIETRAGPEPVFNLEINVEHVYCVTSSGVLAHNMCDTPKGSNHPKVRSRAIIGQEAHRQLQRSGSKTWGAEKTIKLKNSGRTVRKDGVDLTNVKRVRIIKPDTKSGRRAAHKRKKLMEDEGYETHVDLYNPLDTKYLPGSPTYIGPGNN